MIPPARSKKEERVILVDEIGSELGESARSLTQGGDWPQTATKETPRMMDPKLLADPTLPSKPSMKIPPPGPRSQEFGKRLTRAECPEVTYISNDFPIFWERGEGCMIQDVDGNVYLDLTAAFGVMSVGHSHPKVVEAVRAQAGRLLHGMGDVHPTASKVLLAERLGEICPGDLGQPLFTLPGAEAVEAARKTCVIATGKPGLVAFEGAYHGLTYGALETTYREDFRAPFAAQLGRSVSFAPYPYCYRCPLRKSYPACELGCLQRLEEKLDSLPPEAPEVGGILIEAIQGRGGIIVPPPEYMPALRRLCDERGLLLIVDEIFTGFCRTGAWFACDHLDIVPDLMTIGKAMGGGSTISACVGTPGVMNCWQPSQGEALHTSTFMGGPLACEAALAAIEVMEVEALAERARAIGEHMLEHLRALQTRHEVIGDVRGKGLMLGVELVLDRSTRTPAADLTLCLIKNALREGLLLLPGGPHGNVVDLTPPLVITREQADLAIEIIDRCLTELT